MLPKCVENVMNIAVFLGVLLQMLSSIYTKAKYWLKLNEVVKGQFGIYGRSTDVMAHYWRTVIQQWAHPEAAS